MDLRPTMKAAIDAFGVDVQVRTPGGDLVETRAFWLADRTEENPVGEVFARAEPLRTLVLPVADVQEVPRGTVITIPEYADSDEALDWRVEESTKVSFDHHRVTVVQNP